MSRPLGQLLDSAASRLFQLAAERPDVAAVAGPLGQLIMFIAADADDHVATSLADAAAIRALLQRAREIMPRDRLAEIDSALAWQPAQPNDFRRQRIDAYLAALRRALIGVHTWLESAEGSTDGALLDDLWAFLKAQAVRSSKLVSNLW